MARKRRTRSLVRTRAGSPYYWYDFTVGGERYRGSTEATDKAAAEEIAARHRQNALRQQRLGEAPPAPTITLDEAFAPQPNVFGAQDREKPRNTLIFPSSRPVRGVRGRRVGVFVCHSTAQYRHTRQAGRGVWRHGCERTWQWRR
jgi:hypothetical protein